MVMMLLFHWAETKRYYDFKNPGSQVQPFSPLPWYPDALKGKENGYPGARTGDACHV